MIPNMPQAQKKPPQQKAMDQTLEDSFPASDPPAWVTPHPAKELDNAKRQSKGRPNTFSKTDFLRDEHS